MDTDSRLRFYSGCKLIESFGPKGIRSCFDAEAGQEVRFDGAELESIFSKGQSIRSAAVTGGFVLNIQNLRTPATSLPNH